MTGIVVTIAIKGIWMIASPFYAGTRGTIEVPRAYIPPIPARIASAATTPPRADD